MAQVRKNRPKMVKGAAVHRISQASRYQGIQSRKLEQSKSKYAASKGKR
jgi:hypothetical protein